MSEILDIAHDMAKGLFRVGAMDEVTLRDVEALCLPQKKAFQADDIRRIRLANNMSQAAFAAMLGIGKTTIQQWEQGQKRPGGAAKRLLDVIERKGLAVLV
ncbi:MAG: helix-turn-helix domain-containing protein [Candidatus Chlorobium antarcticum]|jgi:putative transcriptional regulator|nr:helix-turn-helix domain-containing protein [Candidatus Chlorobium antarcticum]